MADADGTSRAAIVTATKAGFSLDPFRLCRVARGSGAGCSQRRLYMATRLLRRAGVRIVVCISSVMVMPTEYYSRRDFEVSYVRHSCVPPTGVGLIRTLRRRRQGNGPGQVGFLNVVGSGAGANVPPGLSATANDSRSEEIRT
jgi:hypothetical protein